MAKGPREIRMYRRKARKDHPCSCCPQLIRKGEEYFGTVVAYGNTIIEFKQHLWDCGYDESDDLGEVIEIEVETENPLVLRDLVLLLREEKEENRNDKTMEI